jgi:hypothetical protein
MMRCCWRLLVPVIAMTVGGTVYCQETRVGRPWEATPTPMTMRPVRPPRPSPSPTAALPSTLPAKAAPYAVNVAVTTATVPRFSPDSYRTMLPVELSTEISRLKHSMDSLTTGTPERRDAEDLLNALLTRQATGVIAEDVISEVAEKVAEFRGLAVKQPIRFRMVSREDLRTILDGKLSRELPPGYLPGIEAVYKLLGALPETADLRSLLLDLLAEQVAGMYDKETKTLYVIRQFDLNRPLARVILSHEIAHALQDQWFDLSKLPLNAPDNDDLAMAAACVVEGDAMCTMQDYSAKALSEKDLVQATNPMTIDQETLEKAPYFVRQAILFPYLAGTKFVRKLIYTNPKARDRAFTKCPESTEQILHPDKYNTLDYDRPTSFALPDLSPRLGPDWRLATSNVLGEFQIRTLFENAHKWDRAARASMGWGGDRYALYRRGEQYVFVLVTTWDDSDAASEFAAEFAGLLGDRFASTFHDQTWATHENARTMAVGGAKPLYLRLRTDGRVVVASITNDDRCPPVIAASESALIDAARGKQPPPVMPADEATTTAPVGAASSTSRSAALPPSDGKP